MSTKTLLTPCTFLRTLLKSTHLTALENIILKKAMNCNANESDSLEVKDVKSRSLCFHG